MGYQFIVRDIHEAIVAFESAKFPGHFVTIAKNGVAMLEREEPKSYFVQFTVYARVSCVYRNAPDFKGCYISRV